MRYMIDTAHTYLGGTHECYRVSLSKYQIKTQLSDSQDILFSSLTKVHFSTNCTEVTHILK